MSISNDEKPTADEVRRVVRALAANGYCVVPVEPTEDMQFAGGEAYHETSAIAEAYRAMIAAAGKPT